MKVPSKVVTVLALATVAFGALAGPAKVYKESTPTYSASVATILNKHCVQCHREGQVAPFSLDSYQSAHAKAQMIALVTEQKLMPPWKAAPGDIAFKDDNALTPAEVQTLQDWAGNQAPRGDQDDEPAPPKFNTGWELGKPDLVVEMPKPFAISASGTDEYWNFVIHPDIKEPVYIQAMDIHPGNRRIVHHVIAYLDEKGLSEKKLLAKDSRDGGYLSFGGPGFPPSGSLGGWAPGVSPQKYPAGSGILVKPGSRIVLQVHYNKSGKPETDQTKIGLYFAKGKITNPLQLAWLLNWNFNIKPNDPNATFTKTFDIPSDVTVYSLMPHMHWLGKSMKAVATYPDGTTKTLIDVPSWDFNWQLVYHPVKPFTLPKGTKLTLTATFDNTTNNPRNPSNPPRAVHWGESTKDEMILLVAVVHAEGEWDYLF